MRYTVISLLPDYATSNWPEDAHHVSEHLVDNREQAVNAAHLEIHREYGLDFMEDVRPLFVIEGGIEIIDSADGFLED